MTGPRIYTSGKEYLSLSLTPIGVELNMSGFFSSTPSELEEIPPLSMGIYRFACDEYFLI